MPHSQEEAYLLIVQHPEEAWDEEVIILFGIRYVITDYALDWMEERRRSALS